MNNVVHKKWCRNIITSGPNCIEDRIGRVSVLQQALMKFADRTTDCIINPEVGTEFDDLHEACEYYNLYSWECGFGIPKGKKRYSNNRANRKLPDDERYQLGQEFNCSCGVRKKTECCNNILVLYL